MLIMQNGDQIAGGGLPVIHITQAQYDANPSAYDSPDVLVHITDATPELMGASSVGYEDTTMKFVGDIATKAIAEKIEFSDTAVYAHTVGERFINKNGNYCKCISAISVGQTLTENTNYKVTTINSDLSDWSSITFSGHTSNLRGFYNPYLKIAVVSYNSYTNPSNTDIVETMNVTSRMVSWGTLKTNEGYLATSANSNSITVANSKTNYNCGSIMFPIV